MQRHTARAVLLAALAVVAALLRPAYAENAAKPHDDPVCDLPTLHSLGVYWIIKGDDNKNAKVEVAYRKAGAKDWLKGLPLFRVEKGAPDGEQCKEKHKSKLDVPKDCWLFAGSILLLSNNTEHEIKLTLSDPDGGSAEKTLTSRTIAEPLAAKDAPQYHVAPGSGGGTGTQNDPYKGLAAAQNKAKPGDIFLLHAGNYGPSFQVDKNGEPGKPIIWRGAGDGEALLGGGDGKAAQVAVAAAGAHDVWFEKLTIRNAVQGFSIHNASRLVIRRCQISKISNRGITFCGNDKNTTCNLFISDNTLEGLSVWPRTKGIEDMNGIHGTGTGHDICYNRVRGFADGIDCFNSQHCTGVDIHNNDISECTDDGSEMDYSERNTRNFFNRYTNVFQGVSVQPVFGGPVYIFRNVLYNIEIEPYKVHNSPSGVLFMHNTVVKNGSPLLVLTPAPAFNLYSRNNLYLGTDGPGYECTPKMTDCDYDYDGYGGFTAAFLHWNGAAYASLAEAKAKAPIYKHAVAVDPATCFASGVKPPDDHKKIFVGAEIDLRLKAGSAAIDAGEVLPNLDDGFAGSGPDLGAYETGWQLPHYGPRPEGVDEETTFRQYEPPKVAAAPPPPVGPNKPVGKPVAAPAAPIDPAPHREALLKLLPSDKAKRNVKARMKILGRSDDVLVKAIDASGLKIALQGNELPLRWKDLSDEDLARLVLAALDSDAQGLFHAGALAASIGLDALRDKIADRLVAVDPEKLKELGKLTGRAP